MFVINEQNVIDVSEVALDSFDTMENVMEVIRFANKGRMMDAIEKFYIYDATRKGTQINDRLTVQRNPIFEAILKHQQHPKIQ